ncbi:hypothetical protein BCR35DRAFT_306940 [Leucosporidium creatinivorum]|uniref:Uncharacterized protein n=1 Tax=Leucosporidium creatinivorum TaxID=106004 RepID=A0A1Y2EQG2_9BASI|nr:hypothetical protein BCR35DRAFT_306940 [Leucosporidium creatinivorum]
MIPSLPTEILHHIIKLSLPVVSFGTYRERYNLLLAYSLVNSTWRALAKKELYEELFVKNSKEAAAALSVEGARETVKRVHLGPYETRGFDVRLEDARLGAWKLPESVTEVRVASLRLELEDLPRLAQLGTLHLHWCDFGLDDDDNPVSPASPPSFALPAPLYSLSTLSLVDPFLCTDSFPAWAHWLNPTTFPSLSRLSLAFTGSSERVGEDDDFRKALSLLAPQLAAFSLAQGGSELGIEPGFPWSKFTTLSRLALFPSYWPATDLLRAALQGIPSSLSALRVGACSDSDSHYQAETTWGRRVLETLSKTFAEGSPSLQALQVLSIEHVRHESNRAVVKSVKNVRQVMEARAGSFEYCLGWEGQDELLDWERFFEPW